MNAFMWLRGLTMVYVFAAGAACAAENPLADHVRIANDRFKDVSIAVSEGYAPIPCADGETGGSMGIHYVNGDYLKDDAIDIAHPEAVMYEPTVDGKLTLVGVEYITSKGPASFKSPLQLYQRPKPVRCWAIL